MPLATAIDIESVCFAAPDLRRMRDFLTDFGLFDAEDDAEDGVLRMRGTGDTPFVHETVQGDPAFVGLTLRVASRADLEALSQAENVPITQAPGPGGGERVTLHDPDGYRVNVIAGKARVAQRPHGTRAPWNVAGRHEREGIAKRVTAGPASVVRLGHVVCGVSDVAASWAWWQDRFGLLMSDEVRAPNGDLAAIFIRCDRGGVPVDHHTLNLAHVPGLAPKFHHAAFEVADLDDLMAGSHFLADRNHQHDWGIGRHVLGSQVFDYWRDPWGHRVEHWTDGDLFDASVPPNVTDIPTMLGHQWGPASPPDFAS